MSFVEDDDLNLEAANLHVLDMDVDDQEGFSEDDDIFYDCRSDLNFPTGNMGTSEVIHDCSMVFKVAAVSSASDDEISDEVETCRTIKRTEKKSLHVPI